jgi:hypothetical protein
MAGEEVLQGSMAPVTTTVSLGGVCGFRWRIPFPPALVIFLLFLLSTAPSCFPTDGGDGFVIDLPTPEADVLVAVQSVASDHVVHGTYVYEREKTLNDAVEDTSSSYFGSWKGTGRVFYKVRRGAIAPRNFKNSSDIGMITVRYIVRSNSAATTHLEIVAVFVEDGSHRVHASNSTVESSEFAEIQDQLAMLQKNQQQRADIRQEREKDIEEEQRAALAKQDAEEAGRNQAAESSLQALERRARELQHAIEVRVPDPNTELKSAPFRSAGTLTKIAANSDVLVEIITTYWYGVETTDGHRGWVRRDQVIPLP